MLRLRLYNYQENHTHIKKSYKKNYMIFAYNYIETHKNMTTI